MPAAAEVHPAAAVVCQPPQALIGSHILVIHSPGLCVVAAVPEAPVCCAPPLQREQHEALDDAPPVVAASCPKAPARAAPLQSYRGLNEPADFWAAPV